jgi:branched-chain amino acid transport system ATP-binding protein
MLRTDNLSKNFSGHVAVDSVNVEVERGSITGLIGPNGSGKTTLFNLITGVLDPTTGRIELNDQDITAWSTTRISQSGLVRTFQQTQPFDKLTVRENMRVPPTTATAAKHEAKINELLSLFDIEHLADEPAENLSYGQQRLLEFARVLMTDPEMILLDEPASGINPALMDDIQDHIETLNDRGITFFVIEHDLEFVGDISDEVIVLANGSQIARGTIDEVRENDRVRNAYLEG